MILLQQLMRLCPDVRHTVDIVVLAIHSFMLEQGFFCVGTDDRRLSNKEKMPQLFTVPVPQDQKAADAPSPYGCVAALLLPRGWNDGGVYCFVYRHARFTDIVLSMKAVTVASSLAISAADGRTGEIHTLNIGLGDFVSSSEPLDVCLLSLPRDIHINVVKLQEEFETIPQKFVQLSAVRQKTSQAYPGSPGSPKSRKSYAGPRLRRGEGDDQYFLSDEMSPGSSPSRRTVSHVPKHEVSSHSKPRFKTIQPNSSPNLSQISHISESQSQVQDVSPHSKPRFKTIQPRSSAIFSQIPKQSERSKSLSAASHTSPITFQRSNSLRVGAESSVTEAQANSESDASEEHNAWGGDHTSEANMTLGARKSHFLDHLAT